MIPLPSIDLVVNPLLAGCKTAVMVGTRLQVSPAFYSLVKHATGDELRKLLASLKICFLPDEVLFGVSL
jgi:hypothetical protein